MDKLVKALGLLSLALGAAELLAPKRVARPFGLKRHTNTLRGFGAREIVSGLGLLTAKDKSPWLWSRVAGDGMDLAALAATLRKHPGKQRNILIAAAAVLGIAVLDFLAAKRSDEINARRFGHHHQPRRLQVPPHTKEWIHHAANDIGHVLAKKLHRN